MHARSTTIRGNPQAVDAMVAYVRDEVMPVVQQVEGFVGLSLLCDRDSGRCIVTGAWESADAMQAAASTIGPLQARGAQILGGEPEVTEYEIAVLHRAHPAGDGAAARVTWVRLEPDQVERMVDAFRTTLLSRLEDLPGFCSVSLLVDRRTGRTATAATYDSREAMAQAGERASSMREELASATGGHITEVAEFELAVAHLRVPETV